MFRFLFPNLPSYSFQMALAACAGEDFMREKSLHANLWTFSFHLRFCCICRASQSAYFGMLHGLEPLNYKPDPANMRKTFLNVGERCNVAGFAGCFLF